MGLCFLEETNGSSYGVFFVGTLILSQPGDVAEPRLANSRSRIPTRLLRSPGCQVTPWSRASGKVLGALWW